MCEFTNLCGRVQETCGWAASRINALVLVSALGLSIPSFALPDRTMGWTANNVTSASDMQNRRGRNVSYLRMPFTPVVGVSRQGLDDNTVAPPSSGYADDGGTANGNFQLSVPVVSLPGRGIDLNLTLHYNSLVWSTIEKKRVFDPDADWPAPGWYLGFGKLNFVVLTDPDGTRHPLMQVDSTHRRTADGTLIDVEDEPCSPSAESCQSQVSYPDGSTAEFSGQNSPGTDRHVTRIVDRNGNFILVSYKSVTSQALTSIIDTVGRKITFTYDGNGNLADIRGPNVLGMDQVLLRLHYLYAGPYATAPHQLHDGVGYLVDAILYPATSTGFWFGGNKLADGTYGPFGAGCYGRDGQLRLVNWQKGMSFDLANGTVSPGETIRSRAYVYTSDSSVAAPWISKITETWSGNSDPAITSIEIKHENQYREVTITYPDGSQNVQIADETPGRVDSGLVYLNVVRAKNGDALSMQITEWEAGSDNAPRVRSIKTQNKNGLTTTTVFEYGPKDKITRVSTFGFDGTLSREKRTTYLTDPRYEAQHLLNLPTQVSIFDGTSVNPISRTDYAYDEFSLTNAENVGQHLKEFDPFQVLPATYEHVPRGNVTSKTSYADATNAKKPILVHRTYDITGNIVSTSQWAGAETHYFYSLVTQYAYPDSIVVGSTDPASKVRTMEQYTYNINIGLPVTHVDVNGIKANFSYSPSGELTEIDRDGSPSYVLTHDPYKQKVVQETRDHAGAAITRSTSQLDGRGQTIRTDQLSDTGATNVRLYRYDFAGKCIAETYPYPSNANDPQWIAYSYDALGRLTAKTMPEGSVYRRFYDESKKPVAADNQLGGSVRTEDAWGREGWFLFDALGRVIEAVEPDVSNKASILMGNGFRTEYVYDAMDNLVRVKQGEQTREYAFDSLSRLVAERVPEKSATLSDAGDYAPTSATRKWSEVRTYDDRTGQLASVTDARGIHKLLNYGTDPLGRLQSVSYADQAQLLALGGAPVHRPSTVSAVSSTTFRYATSGDLARPERIDVGGQVVQTFAYDSLGRVRYLLTSIGAAVLPGSSGVDFSVSEAIVPARNGDLSLVTLYGYDDVGRISSVGESEVPPFANPLALNRAIHNASSDIKFSYGQGGYAASSDVRVLNFESTWQISHLSYDSGGEVVKRSFLVTNPLASSFGLEETFNFDKKSRFLVSHSVTPTPTGPLLPIGPAFFDRSYGYTRPATSPIHVLGAPAPQVGQLTRQSDSLVPGGNQQFTYDVLGNLSQAKLGINSSATGEGYESLQTYEYDRYGNRIVVSAVAPGSCGSPTCPLAADLYDGLPQLDSDSSTNHIVQSGVEYDEAGNLLAAHRLDGRLQQYQYDAAGRLVAVLDEKGNIVEHYVYGADRRRILSFTSNGEATAYSWDRQNTLAEYDVLSGAHRFRVDDQNATLVLFSDDGRGGRTIQYRVNDHNTMRSVISVNDQTALSAVPAFSATYLDSRPFGINRPGQPPFDEQFRGYQRSDATGLDYARNRFYDPELGRFLQPDPLGNDVNGGMLPNPQKLDLYTYVTNDPINESDPSGLLPRLNIPGCGDLPGDTWVLGGCVSSLPAVGYASLGYTDPSGTGWGAPVDFRFRLASSVIFNGNVSAAQRELILEALIHVETTAAGQNLADLLGSDPIFIERIHAQNSYADPDTRTLKIGVPFEGDVPYTSANGDYSYTLDRVLAHELGHLTGLDDAGPGSMLNVNVWENQVMREDAPWQPDRIAY